MRHPCALFLCGLFIAPIAFGQDQNTGYPPYGSFEHGRFDGVNRQNLNVNLAVPVVSVPGRGMDLGFPIVYDSLIWKRSGSTWAPVTDHAGNPTWGWKKEWVVGHLKYFINSVSCGGGHTR